MHDQHRQTVHLAVYDGLADWQAGHAIAHLRNKGRRRTLRDFDVVTVGLSGAPVTTMGGLTVLPDIVLPQLKPAGSAMLILPGSPAWDDTPETMAPFGSAAGIFLDTGVPVAAICGATAGLAREGVLDHRDHTSTTPEYLLATGYAGASRYRDALAVTDGDLVTAGPTAPIEFAREIFTMLEIWPSRVLDAWYRLYSQHDPAAHFILAEEA